MKKIEGGVMAAKGFKAAGVEANIKYSGRKDMAIVYSESACTLGGVFTSNVVKAAPVYWDKDIVKNAGEVHAAIINSGIANACTGEDGMEICRQMAQTTAGLLEVNEKEILISSTGVIGMQIPFEKAKKGIENLCSLIKDNKTNSFDAASAIITTDTHPKEIAFSFELDGKEAHIGAMAKGSGMIHPNMCTMLCFVTSDVAISHELLQKALSEVVMDTFNMISVDGDMSTNDSLMVMCNGEAQNDLIKEENENYEIFKKALFEICSEMAKELAGDGEGATALFETKVVGADTKENARLLAKSVICSNLTKAAIYGHDANWGRILCALGYSGAQFNPENIDLYIESEAGKILIFTKGKAAKYSEEEATKILSQKKVTALVDMKMGECDATAWGCDLTYDYVKINADYRS